VTSSWSAGGGWRFVEGTYN